MLVDRGGLRGTAPGAREGQGPGPAARGCASGAAGTAPVLQLPAFLAEPRSWF